MVRQHANSNSYGVVSELAAALNASPELPGRHKQADVVCADLRSEITVEVSPLTALRGRQERLRRIGSGLVCTHVCCIFSFMHSEQEARTPCSVLRK